MWRRQLSQRNEHRSGQTGRSRSPEEERLLLFTWRETDRIESLLISGMALVSQRIVTTR